ncbi:hypothetical protein ACFQ51_56145 [Streptomyces kaempferi]
MKITALATGFVMATLDVTVVNVASATIQEQLQTTLTQLTWIVDGYVLTFASLLMLAADWPTGSARKRSICGGWASSSSPPSRAPWRPTPKR